MLSDNKDRYTGKKKMGLKTSDIRERRLCQDRVVGKQKTSHETNLCLSSIDTSYSFDTTAGRFRHNEAIFGISWKIYITLGNSTSLMITFQKHICSGSACILPVRGSG